MASNTAQHRILSNNRSRANDYRSPFGGDNGSECDTGFRANCYIAADHCRWGDNGRLIDRRALTSMGDDHASSVARVAIKVSQLANACMNPSSCFRSRSLTSATSALNTLPDSATKIAGCGMTTDSVAVKTWRKFACASLVPHRPPDAPTIATGFPIKTSSGPGRDNQSIAFLRTPDTD